MSIPRRKLFTFRSFAGFIVGILLGFFLGWINIAITNKLHFSTISPLIIQANSNYKNSIIKRPCIRTGVDLLNNNIIINYEDTLSEKDNTVIRQQKHLTDDEITEENNQLQSRQMQAVNSKDNSKNAKQENFLYIGVLTAKKYLPTRGKAIHDTWSKHVPGKVEFYVGGAGSNQVEESIDLPIVRLPTVDDNAYPPQKKSFMLLKTMYDRYLEGYQWFMRADDDIYLKAGQLETFLRKLNSSDVLYIGQTGMGNEEERGKLSLNNGENYCMGGPGMIFSREVIRRVAPNIKYCLQHLYTWHEDVEISRCVRKFAGVNCVWSYEMKHLFYEHYSKREGYIDPVGHPDSAMEIEQAITLHPNKKPDYQRKLHRYLMKGQYTKELSQIRGLSRDVISMDTLIDQPSDLDEFMLGIPPSLRRFVPEESKDVQPWDFFSNYYYKSKTSMPRRGMPKHVLNAAKDIVMSIMLDLNSKSMARGRVIEFQKITYGYLRINPLFGAEYVLDILLRYNRYRGKKVVIPVRRHAYLQQTFAKTVMQEETELNVDAIHTYLRKLKPGLFDSILKHPASAFANLFNANNPNPIYSDIDEKSNELSIVKQKPISSSVLNTWHHTNPEKNPLLFAKVVNIIIPLTGRFDTFRKFMKNLEEIAWLRGDPVNVLIMLFMSSNDNHSEMHLTQLLIQDYSDRYPERDIRFIPVAGEFSRGLALELGSQQYTNSSLLFLCDVDVIFSSEFIDRCRLNTVQGRSVYYPILFSQFQTASTTASVRNNPYLLDKNFGYWRSFGYGLLCVYRSDFAATGGYDTSIRGWGLEDVDLFSKFVAHSFNKDPSQSAPPPVTARAIRVEEPGLIHIYHTVKCDSKLQENQYKMCISSRASGIKSTWDLSGEWRMIQQQHTLKELVDNGEIIDSAHENNILLADGKDKNEGR